MACTPDGANVANLIAAGDVCSYCRKRAKQKGGEKQKKKDEEANGKIYPLARHWQMVGMKPLVIGVFVWKEQGA